MKKRELQTELNNFIEIRDFVEGLLGQRGIDKQTKAETLLVFEALYNDMLAQGVPEDTVVQVWRTRPFGDIKIKIAFEGSMYVPSTDSENEFIAEEKIITAYADKFESKYQNGRNILILTAKRSALRKTSLNLIALLLAVLAYIPISRLTESNGSHDTVCKYILQLENLFTNAILSIGAPVTFLSLLRNLTGMFISAEGNSRMRKLEAGAVMTSLAAVVLAYFMCLIILLPQAFLYVVIMSAFGEEAPVGFDMSVKENSLEIVESIVNPSIFGSFETFSPFPLIFLAILTTYALCSSGNYYESINKVIDGMHVLFCNMLSALMFMMPFFCFLGMLDIMLMEGKSVTVDMILTAVLMPVAVTGMWMLYSMRLMTAGIRPLPFFRKMIPLIRENLKISSTIDAVPFNTRYCVTHYGIDRKLLDDSLPALARLNLDGNCFVIMYLSLMFLVFNGISSSRMYDVLIIGIVIFFLSLGAPNQPGSILIGLLVVISYVHAPWAISIAIVSEALYGSTQSLINAVGDIVTVAVAEKNLLNREERLKRQKEIEQNRMTGR